MHCPSCGKPADADQQFCRACGMGLETVGKLVSQHTSTSLSERKVRKAELEQRILRQMYSWMVWGMIILGIGIVMIVADKSFAFGSWFKFLATMMSLAGIGVATAGVFSALKQGVGISGKKPLDQISGVDTKSLPTRQMPGSLPSVTEHTTQLLPTDDRTKDK